MKIQFLINSLVSGGAERVAVNLLNELSKRRYAIVLHTLEKDKHYDTDRNILYKPLSNLTVGTHNAIRIFYLPTIIIKYFIESIKNKPDIFISFLELSNFINIFVGKGLINKKVVISTRINPLIMYPSETIYGKIHNTLIKLLYPKADKVIAVSKKIRDVLSNQYNIPREKIGVIYNPHNIQNYLKLSEELIEDKYREIFKDSFVFINIGRLTEQKGQWFLIRAFKKVVEAHSNAKLIILGEGELRKELEDLIRKLNLENKVFLVGVHKNPFKFLKNSQCYTFPSLWEGLPNTLIEALTLNLPIISTDCETGPREILTPELNIDKKIDYPYFGKYGILIKPFPRNYIFKDLEEKILIEQEKQLAELMIRMVEDKDLRKKYSNGLERARDFDMDRIIKRWEKVVR
ncbi:glycosyltransferase [Methanothermococcus sp. SCGC AD-155-M21]|nr:glycosyltransferase [Methanothermococcus sp. SCGC AD-155-M21]